jgi:hypothetical protein
MHGLVRAKPFNLRRQIFADDDPDRLAIHGVACAHNVSEVSRAVGVVVRLLLNPPRFARAALLLQRLQTGEQLETFRRMYVHPLNTDPNVGHKIAGG